jgi:hypothetical protein
MGRPLPEPHTPDTLTPRLMFILIFVWGFAAGAAVFKAFHSG